MIDTRQAVMITPWTTAQRAALAGTVDPVRAAVALACQQPSSLAFKAAGYFQLREDLEVGLHD